MERRRWEAVALPLTCVRVLEPLGFCPYSFGGVCFVTHAPFFRVCASNAPDLEPETPLLQVLERQCEPPLELARATLSLVPQQWRRRLQEWPHLEPRCDRLLLERTEVDDWRLCEVWFRNTDTQRWQRSRSTREEHTVHPKRRKMN